MAHKLNANFYLYTGTDNEAECDEAIEFLTNTVGLEYTHMHYHDSVQTQEVYSNLKTWFRDETDLRYPFVVYDEVYDLTDRPNRIPRCVNGLSAIKSADWNSIINFAG